jgi:alanyl-tRNA synthetase
MTERAYYSDSYTREFRTRVLEHVTHADRPAVVLEQTYFYPNVGGQPDDRGTLNGVPVVEIAIRESDKAILHVLAQPLTGTNEVEGVIDWPRRWDHMQQHTGQHILSQAFIRSAEAVTIGFHLGAETVTIDLDTDHLSQVEVDKAERIANDLLAANPAIKGWFPTPEELTQIALRKTPDVDGPLRVIAIGDFDVTACGGTHVRQAAEVAVIKILKMEKQKKATRIEFICGQRALTDYARKHSLVSQLAADLTCGVPEVVEAVGRVRSENQSLRKDLRTTKDELLDHEAVNLLNSTEARDGYKLVRGLWPEREMADLRGLATRLVASNGVLALLGSTGEKANLVFARSADLKQDMNALFKASLPQLAGARGGGSPNLAQGGGVRATNDELVKVLNFAEEQLKSHA